VKRVEARADYLARQEFEALENEMRELAVRRQRREIQSQVVVEKAADAIAVKITKLIDMPSVNVSSEKTDTKTGEVVINKVSAMRPGEIAKLSREWRELNATAVHGWVRISKTIRLEDAPAEASQQTGTCEFIPTEPPETP
jgi:ribosomal protein L18